MLVAAFMVCLQFLIREVLLPLAFVFNLYTSSFDILHSAFDILLWFVMPRRLPRGRRGSETPPYRLPISCAPAIALGLPARDVSAAKPLLFLFLTSSFDILHSAFCILLCPCLCSSCFSYLLPPIYYLLPPVCDRLICPGGFCPFIQV